MVSMRDSGKDNEKIANKKGFLTWTKFNGERIAGSKNGVANSEARGVLVTLD